MVDQSLTASFSKELGVGSFDRSWSEVLAVGSPSKLREFRHLAYFNEVTVGVVQLIPDMSSMHTERVWYALNG